MPGLQCARVGERFMRAPHRIVTIGYAGKNGRVTVKMKRRNPEQSIAMSATIVFDVTYITRGGVRVSILVKRRRRTFLNLLN